MTKRERLENTIKEMETTLEMLKKELEEVIKAEESTVEATEKPKKSKKAPKKNINKCLTVDDVLESTKTLDADSPVKYNELAWNISEEDIRIKLNAIELKHIKKIAKEAGYTERSSSKKTAINNLIDIIMSRRTKGDVFKTR
jgi:hypothetical protein